MDLRLYSRVIWRFRLLVLVGLLGALLLAFLSFFKVSFQGFSPDSVTYRQQETWASNSTMLVTQRGFPAGWTVQPPTVDENGNPIPGATPYADQSRFEALAVFYSVLANSDAVRKIATKSSPLHGQYSAKAIPDPSNKLHGTLPFLTISGVATTPQGAVETARRATEAFRQFLVDKQARADIPDKQKVKLQVVNEARGAKLVKGRRLTIPIVVFLTGLIATLGLAFVLENLRPRLQSVPESAEDVGPRPTAIGERHSA
jgi:hypothetical protein